jgi:hypothetical protein
MRMDVNSLTQGLTDNVTTDITGQLVAWFLIPSIVITVLFLVIYSAHIVRRRHVENAIFEIRDLLREIRDSQPKP